MNVNTRKAHAENNMVEQRSAKIACSCFILMATARTTR